MRYNMVNTSEGRSTIVMFIDGEAVTVTDSHPNYLRIAQALLADEDPSEWMDPTVATAASVVVNLSARVSVVDDVVHFDGEPVHSGLASTIERYHREGRDATNLVRFMERLASNPSENSREQLFNWTQAQDLTIDRDGFIVGYKGVSERSDDRDYLDDNGEVLFPLDEYPFVSASAGHGIVDGIEIEHGRLPMGVGVTVEMPRSEVNDNPREGCSTGLHVGDYNYAIGYAHAGALLEVKFDPADVVSVPSDCGFAKLRCCRYTGVAIHDVDLGDDLSDHEPEAYWDDDEAWDAFADLVPSTFMQRLRDRIKRR